MLYNTKTRINSIVSNVTYKWWRLRNQSIFSSLWVGWEMVCVTPDTKLPLEEQWVWCMQSRVWTQAPSHFRGNPSPCQHPSSLATVGEHRTLQSHIRRPTRPEYGVFDNVQHFVHDGQRAVLRICGVRDRLFKSPSPGKKYVDLSFTEAVMTPTVL